MQQVKYIIKYLLSLVSEPEQTWKYLSEGDVDESKPDYVQTNYYLPLMGGVALGIFILVGWGIDFNIEKAMKGVVIFLAAYFAGPFLATAILRQVNRKAFKIELAEDKLQVFVAYCMGFLMIIQLLSAAFPTVKFISFSALYLFYIVWCASDMFFGITENNRWKFSALGFFIMWIAPKVIEYIMSLMIR